MKILVGYDGRRRWNWPGSEPKPIEMRYMSVQEKDQRRGNLSLDRPLNMLF